ncbi:sugar ABC transporter permease [Paracoccus sp. YIM 132242]|uniref:Transport permease protein n=1 Tax=Paracoccus lichenicola TaxID=2665644 RepID=A0A6L6HKL6_9RHOB|nr:ABC transporter permease [Paracoccus lichenicola]MTD99078.1 sugar ABC transporter permease [Paracoccus lichenicola]
MSKITFPSPAANPAPSETLRLSHRHRSFSSLRAVSALVLREMSTTNGRSAGGYLWAVAEPVAGIVLLTMIFSILLAKPPIGTNFPIFYATGMVPFLFYMAMSAKVSQSVIYSKALLAYPAVTFMDALLARMIMNAITQLLVAYLIFAALLMFQETRTDPQAGGIALSLLMAFAFGVAVGVVNCFLNEAFPWWQQVWAILNRPLFLISCVLFVYDDIPSPFADYLWYNPLVHIVGQMRKSFYPSYPGDYVSPAYVLGVSLLVYALGLALLIRYHRDLQNS